MKTNTLLILSFFVFIISLWACNETQDSQSSSHSNSEPGPCHKQIFNSQELPYAYKDSCAVAAINAYQNTIDTILDSLPDKDSSDLIYGARVDIDELRSVLVHHFANKTGFDSLYVMLGITEEKETHIIFALQNTSDNDASTVQTQYFNFTYPCPSSCPED